MNKQQRQEARLELYRTQYRVAERAYEHAKEQLEKAEKVLAERATAVARWDLTMRLPELKGKAISYSQADELIELALIAAKIPEGSGYSHDGMHDGLFEWAGKPEYTNKVRLTKGIESVEDFIKIAQDNVFAGRREEE